MKPLSPRLKQYPKFYVDMCAYISLCLCEIEQTYQRNSFDTFYRLCNV